MIDSDNAPIDAMRRQAQRMQKKGTIEIRVYNGDYGRKGGGTPGTSEGFFGRGNVHVPEKALKGQAKSHGTRYAVFPNFPKFPSIFEACGNKC